MAHGQSPIIKCEIDSVHCNPISVINKSSSLVGNSVTLGSAAAMPAQPNVSDGSGAASHSGAGNARTGSRRIFTPQFKLQVLESYRSDSDCKGNQRATARKYGIHRRQIQKWLQCEKNLRASVANYSQNNVKHHQFHNITHHQMTMSPPSTAATAIGAAPIAAATTTPAPAIAQTATAVNTHTTSGAYAHHNNNNNNLHYHHHHHQSYKTALEAARHSVALASAPSTVGPAALAPAKCMNGLPLTQPGAPTNTVSLRPPYTQTPAIKPVLLIQPHQSPLHHHHHPQRQHDVHMPSECLPERPHEQLEHHPPMNAPRNCFENFHRPQAQYAYEYCRRQPGAPIDLSVGPRRLHESIQPDEGLSYIRPEPVKSEGKWYVMPEANNNDQKLEFKTEAYSTSSSTPAAPNPVQAVDLSCRKRASRGPNPASPPAKVQRTDSNVPTTKPVKLFKPYLLDNGDPKESESKKSKEQGERKDAIIWSNHPAAGIPSPHYDTQSNHSNSSNFQPSPTDPAYTFPLGSPHSSTASSPTISSMSASKFQSSPASSLCDRVTPPSSTNLPSSPATVHATTLMWCPKGSPVSGYDTASNYSDSSELHAATASASSPSAAAGHQSFRGHQQPSPIPIYDQCTSTTRYNLDVKVEPLDAGAYYHHNPHDVTAACHGNGPIRTAAFSGKYSVRHNHHEVHRWLLDHETTTHHRHGIAVYV